MKTTITLLICICISGQVFSQHSKKAKKLYQQAKVLSHRADGTEIVPLLNSCIEVARKDKDYFHQSMALLTLGRYFIMVDRLDGLSPILSELEQLEKEFPEAKYCALRLRGGIHYRLFQWEKALSYFQEVANGTKSQNTNTDEVRISSLRMAALCYRNRGIEFKDSAWNTAKKAMLESNQLGDPSEKLVSASVCYETFTQWDKVNLILEILEPLVESLNEPKINFEHKLYFINSLSGAYTFNNQLIQMDRFFTDCYSIVQENPSYSSDYVQARIKAIQAAIYMQGKGYLREEGNKLAKQTSSYIYHSNIKDTALVLTILAQLPYVYPDSALHYHQTAQNLIEQSANTPLSKANNLLPIADYYYYSGNYLTAAELYDKHLPSLKEYNSKSVARLNGTINLGQIKTNFGFASEGITYLQEAIELQKEIPNTMEQLVMAHLGLSQAYMNGKGEKEKEKALAALKKVKEQLLVMYFNQRMIPHYGNLLLGALYWEEIEFAEAALNQLKTQVLQYAQFNSNPHYLMNEAYFEGLIEFAKAPEGSTWSKKFKESLEMAELTTFPNTDHPHISEMYAQYLEQTGQVDASLEILDRGIEYGKNNLKDFNPGAVQRTMSRKLNTLFSNQRITEALDYSYEVVLYPLPNLTLDRSFFDMSSYLQSLGLFERAKEYADSSYHYAVINGVEESGLVEILNHKGQLMVKTPSGENTDSLLNNTLERSLKLESNNSPLIGALVNYVNFLTLGGKSNIAIEKSRALLSYLNEELEHFRPFINNTIGELYFTAGQIDSSSYFYQQSIIANKDEKNLSMRLDALNSLARNEAIQNNHQKAIQYLDQANNYILDEKSYLDRANLIPNIYSATVTAEYYMLQSKLTESEKILTLCQEKIKQQQNVSIGIKTVILQKLASLHYHKKEYKQSILNAETCLQLLEENPSIDQQIKVPILDVLVWSNRMLGFDDKVDFYLEKKNAAINQKNVFWGSEQILRSNYSKEIDVLDVLGNYESYKQQWELVKEDKEGSVARWDLLVNLGRTAASLAYIDEAQQFFELALKEDFKDYRAPYRLIDSHLGLAFVHGIKEEKNLEEYHLTMAKKTFEKIEDNSLEKDLYYFNLLNVEVRNLAKQKKTKKIKALLKELEDKTLSNLETQPEFNQNQFRSNLGFTYLFAGKEIMYMKDSPTAGPYFERAIQLLLSIEKEDFSFDKIQDAIKKNKTYDRFSIVDAFNQYIIHLRDQVILHKTKEQLAYTVYKDPEKDPAIIELTTGIKNTFYSKDLKDYQPQIEVFIAEQRIIDLTKMLLYIVNQNSNKYKDVQQAILANESRKEYYVKGGLAHIYYDRSKDGARKAFELMEQGKGATLQRLISTREKKIELGVSLELIARETALRDSLNLIKRKIAFSSEEELSLLSYKSELIKKLNSLNSNIRTISPQYFEQLTQEEAVKLSKVQANMEKGSVVLSFNSFVNNDLPTETVFDPSTGEYKEYQYLDIFTYIIFPDTIFFNKVTDKNMLHLMELLNNPLAKDGAFERAAFKLYKRLFPKATVELIDLKKTEKLIIIPDANLGNLPFEVLLTENIDPDFQYENYPFLLKKYNVSYSYSANLFCLQQEKNQKKKVKKRKKVLAMAPVKYQSNFNRVNYTGELVESIAQIPSFQVDTFTFQNAITDHLWNSIEKSDYDYVLLASHGVIDDQDPDLSYIAMAQDQMQHLFLGDLYNRQLNTDLIALSACETNHGKKYYGEGIQGFTHALLYAGCNNILVSQTKVGPSSTYLMETFFQILHESKGSLKYSEALRKTKLKMLEHRRYANPYYWSSFVLIGN